jgi:2-polyprenyl-3-methyl-5-hydroxy-6-metoxy-1,4-benzoquinol methylase
MRIGPDQLDEFVAEIDRRGGAGSPAASEYYAAFEYAPNFQVDKTLDPFQKPYLEQQLSLYREISGRDLNQYENERTHFDVPTHIAARNPYNHPDPSQLALHLVRLSSALRFANKPVGARLLDMGCGWGLSSELAAYLGFEVHALDINPKFIELVRTRSDRLNLNIRTHLAGFDEFSIQQKFDAILFYECLHHAVTPWSLLRKMSSFLGDRGKILICGEPINEFWWPTWGLRLDAVSVYVMRRNGWFESGWSKAFLIECLDRALFNTRFLPGDDPEVGAIVVGSKDGFLNADWLSRNCVVEGAQLDGPYVVAFGDTKIQIRTPIGGGEKNLILHNFRPRPVQLKWWTDGGEESALDLSPGLTKLPVGDVNANRTIHLKAETWVPAEEIGNLDRRRLAFQISGLEGRAVQEVE